ncbi:glutathione S-transferase N-terminal domain-containing protein [Candidatus Pacearchaeota archaeon]|nr:glutathione S-transferase N-terminal domain-containing protein [Candidatus Pacearchaeota archaeon]
MITVYTTPTCPWCNSTKEFLDNKKIKYKVIDVSNNKKAAAEMVKKSGQYGVPVIDVDGNIIVGYDQEKIEQSIKKMKAHK